MGRGETEEPGQQHLFFVRKIPLKSNTFEEKTNHQQTSGLTNLRFDEPSVRAHQGAEGRNQQPKNLLRRGGQTAKLYP
jgi:hypothetical protein